MLNVLHSMLINQLVAPDVRVAGFDIVGLSRVSPRHDVVERLSRQLLGETLQDQHYWACRVRQLIRRSPLHSHVGFQQLEGGRRLDDVSSDLVLSQRPQYIAAAGSRLKLERFGDLVGDAYTLYSFDLTYNNLTVTARRPDGSVAAEALAVNGMANLHLFENAGCRVPVEHLPGKLEWGTRISLSTAVRYSDRYPELSNSLANAIELPSCYPMAVREQLLDAAGLLAFADTAFAAAALLVAGHTASLYDQNLT